MADLFLPRFLSKTFLQIKKFSILLSSEFFFLIFRPTNFRLRILKKILIWKTIFLKIMIFVEFFQKF